MDINEIKSQFPIFSKKINGKKLVYLDSSNSAQKPISVLKVSIKPHPRNDYYVTNMWLFAEIVDDVAKYHKIAFKKSGASSFNFNVEGTGTVPENKITDFPL